jgi:photosystem II stability/assembly factor-like uncharacterized protein
VRRLATPLGLAAAAILAACGPALGPASSSFSALSGSGSLQMLNVSDGWTYGNDMVARTSDGARTFNVVTPPGVGGDSQVTDPFFLDSVHAWVWVIRWNQSVLASAILERTTNGGASWTAIPFQPAVEGGMTFIDPQHGWMTTARDVDNHTAVENTLWRTADGGETWAAIHTTKHRLDIEPNVQRGDCFQNGIAWTSGTYGIAGVSCPYDSPPAVQVTGDAGATWRTEALPPLPTRPGVVLFATVGPLHDEGGELVAVVSRCVGTDGNSCRNYGEVYRSADGGMTWSHGAVVWGVGDVLLADADHAWLPDACPTDQCYGSQLLVSSNGGSTWQELPVPSAFSPNMHASRTYSLVTPTLGFVVVWNEFQNGPTYYKTTDGGRTFSPFTPRFVAPRTR